MNTKGKVNWPYAILAVLLAADVFLIVVHIVTVQFWNQKPSFFLLDAHGFGIAESFQYLKYSTIMILLIYLIGLKKEPDYVSLSVLFAFLLLDDMLQLHHIGNQWIVDQLHLERQYKEHAIVIGQLVYTIALIVFFLAWALWNYKLAPKHVKIAYRDIFFLLGLFLVFGVGVDMMHRPFEENCTILFGLTLVEEGGEMIILSLLVWYCYSLIMIPQNLVGKLKAKIFTKTQTVKT